MSIEISKDPWIPTSPDRKIITPRGDCVLTKVYELIDPTSGAWDEALVLDIFHTIDATGILQIPLSVNGFNDFLAWNGTREQVSFQYECLTTWSGSINSMDSLVEL
jgi:hypothetical protein